MTLIPVAEILKDEHKSQHFSCGDQALDIYIKQYAKQDQKRRIAAVFVIAGEDKIIKGFYALSSTNIPSGILPEKILKKLPRHPYQPATLLGRLAVDAKFQKQKVGETLLLDALNRSYTLSEQVGSIAVVVDAVNENAVSFYENYGFMRLSEQKRLFLPMKIIGKLF